MSYDLEYKTLDPETLEKRKRWIEHFEKKRGFVFYKPSFTQVPAVSSFYKERIDAFGNRKRVENTIEGFSELENYLLGTYPIKLPFSDFSGNGEADKYRRETLKKPEFAVLKEMNKLGVSSCLHAASCAQVLAGYFNQKEYEDRFLYFIGQKYSSFNFETKLEFVATLDAELYKFLENIHINYVLPMVKATKDSSLI